MYQSTFCSCLWNGDVPCPLDFEEEVFTDMGMCVLFNNKTNFYVNKTGKITFTIIVLPSLYGASLECMYLSSTVILAPWFLLNHIFSVFINVVVLSAVRSFVGLNPLIFLYSTVSCILICDKHLHVYCQSSTYSGTADF